MTQEEKAKAYDEVFKKAKEMYASVEGMKEGDVLEEIFPEFKECKGEKIRKALLEMVHDTTGDSLRVDYGVHKEDAIAWLEKQRDKDKLIQELGKYKVKYTQEVLNGYLNISNKDGERLRKTTIDFLKEFADKGYENAVECIDWLEKQGGQKSAEWSEEDKVILNNIIWGVHMKSIKPLDEMEDRSKYKKYEDFLKSLPARFSLRSKAEWSEEDEVMLRTAKKVIFDSDDCSDGTTYKLIDWFKSLKERVQPQPKQEWSKEDEKTWKELIEEVKDQLDSVPAPDCRVKEDEKVLKQLNKWLTWLKSLKERYTWKPTEEQMEFLKKCIEAYNEVTFPTEVRVLSSLYNDLKKL